MYTYTFISTQPFVAPHRVNAMIDAHISLRAKLARRKSAREPNFKTTHPDATPDRPNDRTPSRIHRRRRRINQPIMLARGLTRALALGHRSLSSSAPKPTTMELIKALRERTGAPIVDVKNALAAHENDAEAAYDALRAKGLAAAAKKTGRTSADGCAGLTRDARGATLIEINAETDFVARNEAFTALVRRAGEVLSETLASDEGFATEFRGARDGGFGECDAVRLAALKTKSSNTDGQWTTLGDLTKETAVNVRENVRLRRAFVYATTAGSEEVIGTYVHGATTPGVGRQAACVVAKGVSEDFANKLAMHVVASAPAYLRSDCVPKDVYEREMAVFRAQTEGSGKPANIVDKILAGRMSKYYEETCLENQKFVMDDSLTVGKAVAAEGGELIAFARVKVGEGIDVEEKNFADEVAEAVRST